MDKPHCLCGKKKKKNHRSTLQHPCLWVPTQQGCTRKAQTGTTLATQQLQLSSSMVQTQDSSKVLSSSLGISPRGNKAASSQHAPREGRQQPEVSCFSFPRCQKSVSGKTATWNRVGKRRITSHEGTPTNGLSSCSVSGPLTHSSPTAKCKGGLKRG